MFAVLLALGVSVAVALCAASLATMLYLGLPADVLVIETAAGTDSATLIAIPLFIFAGQLMLHGGISERLIAFAATLVGHVRGGLGQVNVLSCLFFGGVSGSAIADVSAIGGSMIPQMVERGYDRDYAVNVTISAALVALLVPPSHNLILYSAAAGGGISIADLFAAGIVPALLLVVSVMLTAYLIARRRGYPTRAFPGVRAVAVELRRGAAGPAARVRDLRRHPRGRLHGRRERVRRRAVRGRRDGARLSAARVARVSRRLRRAPRTRPASSCS